MEITFISFFIYCGAIPVESWVFSIFARRELTLAGCNYHHGQNRLDLGKLINLLPVKIKVA